MSMLIKTFILVVMIACAASNAQEPTHNFLLNFEPPNFFSETPSPLRNRENLRQREYFDFLNVLYRHDKTKADLFQGKASENYPVYAAQPGAIHSRRARAVIFRPLFVYKQQQIKKQKVQGQRPNQTK